MELQIRLPMMTLSDGKMHVATDGEGLQVQSIDSAFLPSNIQVVPTWEFESKEGKCSTMCTAAYMCGHCNAVYM